MLLVLAVACKWAISKKSFKISNVYDLYSHGLFHSTGSSIPQLKSCHLAVSFEPENTTPFSRFGLKNVIQLSGWRQLAARLWMGRQRQWCLKSSSWTYRSWQGGFISKQENLTKASFGLGAIQNDNSGNFLKQNESTGINRSQFPVQWALLNCATQHSHCPLPQQFQFALQRLERSAFAPQARGPPGGSLPPTTVMPRWWPVGRMKLTEGVLP